MKIGFYDSGLGGAKTLKDIIDMGLTGDIYFLADTKNCPYGTKDIDELNTIIDKNINYLINIGCKVIVIACNTATSVAIKKLRNKYKDITFIGTEPAIKPALEDKHNKIMILGTTRTVKGDKLKELVQDSKDVYLVAADNLVKLIENNEDVDNYLKNLFKSYNMLDISHIVLGCTHFPIVKDSIKKLVSNSTKVIDGNVGIGNNLLSKIDKSNDLTINVIITVFSDIKPRLETVEIASSVNEDLTKTIRRSISI